MNNITGVAIEIGTLLSSKSYTVQYYQREYSWGKKQIDELVEDLTTEFLQYYQEDHSLINVKEYGAYFLGPIIITDDGAIIDGQQRISSITLLLIYLNNLQKELNTKRVNVDNLIVAENYGEKTFCVNLKEREDCLNMLYAQGAYEIKANDNESVINLSNRYIDIDKVFEPSLRGEALPLLIEWIKNKVIFVRITTNSEQDAHKVFVTMNDRGLRLTPTEMLKGYLLSEINDLTIKNKANDLWKKTILKLKETEKDGDADFIKDWIRSQYAETIREGKKNSVDKDFEFIGQTFHKWIRENKQKIKLTNSINYENFILKQFDLFSEVYLKLKKYSSIFDKEYEYVFYNADRNFTFQYQMVLASIHPEDTTKIINKKIKLMSCFIDQFIALRIFNFKTVDYSSIKYTVFTITKLVRRKNLKDLQEILKTYILNMDFKLEKLNDFYLNQFTARYMLHILSRLTYFIEEKCGLSTSFYNYVNRNQKNPFDIEHIWAKDYDQGEHKKDFATEQDFEHYRNYFGGLLVLAKDKNRSFQDMDYINKVIKYDSENLLARTLNTNCYSNNPHFLKLMNEGNFNFKAYTHFNKDQFVERQLLYKDLAKQIWDVDLFEEIINK